MNTTYVLLDFDGVVVDTVHAHYELLNQAIVMQGENPIPFSEHLQIYDGLTTVEKLRILSQKNQIKSANIKSIIENKKKLTLEYFKNIVVIPDNVYETVKWLQENYTVIITSNSDLVPIKAVLDRYPEFKDVQIISKNDVVFPKPHREIIDVVLNSEQVEPSQCVVIDDSNEFLNTASSVGTKIIRINNLHIDMQINKIQEQMQ